MELSKDYFNIAIFGKLNSGKCTLAKALSIATNSISTPSYFTYENKHYHILPIACTTHEFQEKYDLSSYMSRIALILVDTQDLTEDHSFYLELILDLLHKGVKNIIICLNKIDISKVDPKYTLNLDFSNYKTLFELNEFNIHYVHISAKEGLNIGERYIECGYSLLETLNIVSSTDNKDRDTFLIYDFYKDEDYFVISGLNMISKLKINEEITVLPLNKSSKLIKICNCEGNYVNEVSSNQFVTLKFEKESFTSDEITRGDLLTLKSIDISQFAKFETFEAEVLFYGGNLPSIISSGFNCFINLNMLDKNCIIENILGEYDGNILLKV